MNELNEFFKLLVGHAIADYPLQGDFLAKGKNYNTPISGIHWLWCLFWHSLIHAGFVFIITNRIEFSLIELLLHMLTDYLKCANKISFNTDQIIHTTCKLVYVVLIQITQISI